VASLLLNRPASRNALNAAMWRSLPQVMASVSADPAVRVVVVRGAGGSFAAGADIGEFAAVFADHAAALAYGALLEAATASIEACGKPVIAAIEGYCIGAGLAIALACDLRLASAGAMLGAPPARLGLIYSLGDTRRLVAAVGPSAAKAMLFTARRHGAAEALRLGLVDEVHQPEAFDVAVRSTAETIAALSPHSIARAKAMVGLATGGLTRETDDTRAWFAEAATGPDFAEGLAAFREKRAPRFRTEPP
jgi:enoyl-CoA hydratase/carnithine racemase